jgi:uncharacterized membrane protein YbhN (UPF0104 family)
MRTLRAHPVVMTFLALALSAAAVIGIAAGYGFAAFGHAWDHLHVRWLALAVAGVVLSVPAYVLSYMRIARVQGGPRLRIPLVIRVVIAGFGAFAASGGFALDKRALQAIEDDEHSATVRVLGLGALEWALLAPAAWISAVALLVAGDHRPMASVLWPWAIAVPAGAALAFWLARAPRPERLKRSGGRIRTGFGQALHGIVILRSLASGAPSCWTAWIGMALYWALEIASFYGAVRFIGLRPNGGELILAYATGYALTRRSLPLGGAGITEALLTFSLHWVGQPVAPALAAVVVYRFFNFVLPTIPALLVRPRVKPLLEAADAGRTPARRERQQAAAGLGHLRR